LFSGEQVTKASSFPLSGGIGSTDQNPYTEVGGQLHNSIGGSQQENHEAFTRRKLQGDLFFSRKVPRRMGGGKSNHLDRIVDLWLLSQSTKSWRIWLAREREIYGVKLLLSWRREKSRGNPLEKKTSPIYRRGTKWLLQRPERYYRPGGVVVPACSFSSIDLNLQQKILAGGSTDAPSGSIGHGLHLLQQRARR
jgi:hypothetical protein